MESSQKTIAVLGAGYGGLRTVLRLEPLLKRNADWRILFIDRQDFHQLKTQLHELAAGRTNVETVSIPIARLIKKRNIEFLQAEITGIDFARHVVTSSRGKTKYDKLVIALGSETEFFGIPGLDKHAFTLTSVDDGEQIKAHMREMFAQAESETDATMRQAMLTFVVGGGGFTGVELATELVDYVSKLRKRFKIPPEEAQIIVIEAEDRVLPGFDLELASQAQKVMIAKSIQLMLKTPCASVEDDHVKLKTGQKIATCTLIWTGGVRASDLVQESGLKYGSRGRVVTNQYLESVDHPDVYVIGDNALVLDPVTNRPLAPSAQLALQQAEVAAVNVSAEIKGVRRVRYLPEVAGEFVSLGGGNAVGWVWRFRVTGIVAWLLKRLTIARYLYSIGGVRLLVPRLWTLFFQ